MSKNLIIITIDGARLDRVKNSKVYNKRKSIFLSQCITYGPHTIAAMHAIFSGSYGTRTGTNSYWSTYKFKKDQFYTLTEYLKDSHYVTFADLHSEIVIPRQGFDQFLIYDQDEELIQRHSKLLEEITEKHNDENFFLYLHYDKIHSSISESVLKVYTNFSKEYFENSEKNNQQYDLLFHDSESYVDQILIKIEELGILDETIVVILSDHGISVGEKYGERAYGSFCYDYTLKTFCYFLDSRLKKKEISQQVRTIDFMPTLLELLEIPLDPNYESLDGVSLMPIFNDLQMKEQIAYSETGNPLEQKEPPKEPNTKSVRTSKWKLIYNEYNKTKELYDLESDPSEEVNLTGKGYKIEEQMWFELQKISET